MKRSVILAAILICLLISGLVLRALSVPEPDYLRIKPEAWDSGHDLQVVAQHLASAVRIKTVSRQQGDGIDVAGFHRFTQFLIESYPQLHASLKWQRINDLSLLYHWQGSDPSLSPILLLGHYDTVPVIAGSEQQWTHPPWSGAIADGYVWGRGTLDDKGMIIAQMETIEQLLHEGYQPRRSIFLAYGHDEEVGGTRGAKKISEHLQAQGLRFSLVLDEGSAIGASGIIPGLDRPVALLGPAEKGYLSLRLTARDSGGHSSMPPRHTAAGRIGAAVAKLENAQMPASLSHNKDFLQSIMAFLPFTQRLLLSNSWLFDSLLVAQMEQRPELNASLRTTTAVTMLAASPKENVLPISASAVINFRIIPGETVRDVVAHVRRVIADDSIDIGATDTGLEPSPVAAIDGPAYTLLQQSARQSWPDDTLLVAPRLVLVTTDTRHYHPVSDQVFRFMPAALHIDDIRSIHGSNERISLANIAQMLRFYRQLIINSDSIEQE
jgi:carboxypeptidase PM20D1